MSRGGRPPVAAGEPFGPDVVAAVCRHMNDDHAQDSLLICRTLGGQPAATAATAVHVDRASMTFTAAVGGAERQVRVPFRAPVQERSEIRTAVVELYEQALRADVPPLSAELRSRTAAAHAEAEGSAFFADLAAGRVSRAQVAALLARLLPVYEALERSGARWADDPVVGSLVVPGLERAARLRADLTALGAVPAPLSPASGAYAARIDQVTAHSRPAFVAHHYTRCLGDLSGGQVLRAALTRSLGLHAGNGGSFFVFEGLRPGRVKRAYRTALDALPFTAAQRAELVRESLVAYRLNTDLARELDTCSTSFQ